MTCAQRAQAALAELVESLARSFGVTALELIIDSGFGFEGSLQCGS